MRSRRWISTRSACCRCARSWALAAQHVELAKTQLQSVKLTFQDLLSQVQDADLTEAVTDLRSQELSYQAAAAAASVLQRASLLDYLR